MLCLQDTLIHLTLLQVLTVLPEEASHALKYISSVSDPKWLNKCLANKGIIHISCTFYIVGKIM